MYISLVLAVSMWSVIKLSAVMVSEMSHFSSERHKTSVSGSRSVRISLIVGRCFMIPSQFHPPTLMSTFCSCHLSLSTFSCDFLEFLSVSSVSHFTVVSSRGLVSTTSGGLLAVSSASRPLNAFR